MYSKSPLQPYDPIVRADQQPVGPFKYIRDNFYGAGQDSFTRPFAESQELFELLSNVNPVAQGTFRKRPGYQFLVDPNVTTVSRLYSYQNLAANIRKLIYVGGTTIAVSNEDGSSLATAVTSNTSVPRIAVSRDYAYIPGAAATTAWASGQKSDGKKWHSVNGTSDFGLMQPSASVNVTSVAVAGNITLVSPIGRVYAGAFQNSTTGHYSDINVGLGSFASGSAGPALPGTGANGTAGVWVSPGNVTANDGVFTTVAIPINAGGATGNLNATNFGFAIPSTGTIYGITVTISKRQSAPNNGTALIKDTTIQLLKAGVVSGENKADTVTQWPVNNVAATSVYGGSTDLWSNTWTPADINNANFGIAIACAHPGTGVGVSNDTAGVDYVQITVTYATGSGANTGPITGKQVSISLPTSNAPAGADKFAILGTLDGGDISTFYIIDTVPVSQTTYVDNTPDNVLVTKNRASEVDEFGIQHGLIDNQFPPLALQFIIKHKGRLYGAVGENLYFSKNLDEITTSTGLVLGRYEEAWPILNSINVSTVGETIRGLLSDGNTLYIGTERHIWRLDGDGPLNFSKPEVIFNEVGILDQDVWQVCFAEGSPVGMLWVTPDNRVIMSNFSSYRDIGTPIQDVLSTAITPSVSATWAQFFSRQEFDLYVLAICTGTSSTSSPDTLCIYDLRGGRWCIWFPTDPLSTGLFNINASGTPQWLIASEWGLTPSTHGGRVYQFLPSATQDRVGDVTPVSFSYTIRTGWMHLGAPTFRKVLNEIGVITNDSSLLVSIDGATNMGQAIGTPNTVISNSPLATGQRGDFKVYLAGSTSKDRYYRFTFSGTSAVVDILEGFTVEAVPFPY